MKTAMEFEVKLQIPFPLNDVVWDHHIFPEIHQDKKQVLVVATRQKDAQLVEEMFTDNGLKLSGLQSESVAVYNYNRLAAEKSGSKSNEAIVDIGFTSSPTNAEAVRCKPKSSQAAAIFSSSTTG